MNKLLNIFVSLSLILFSACNVHEFPEIPEFVTFHLRLNFETEITNWEHSYNGESVVEQGMGETYNNHLHEGLIRYVIRAYPTSHMSGILQEFIITKAISEGYNHEVTLDLLPGDYTIMVWSDLVQSSGDTPFYNATNFAEIVLQGEYVGTSDYRDAYRGSKNLMLVATPMEYVPDTLDIVMQRPLAKYQIVTTDLQEFIDKEYAYQINASRTSGEDVPTRIDIDDYKVVFNYLGFVPDTYNMNSDKPVDSRTGLFFESKITILSDNQASLGFDYLFMNGNSSLVTIQIALYDKDDRQVALSNPLNIPLRRNHQSLIKGSFMVSEASGGLVINPEFDGNHNVVIY